MKKKDHLRKAWGFIELSMYEDAMGEIEKATALDTDDPGLFYVKAECLRELKKFAEAIEAYRRALGLGGEVVHNSIGLGWCLKRTGQLDKAIETLSRALESEGEIPLLFYNLACYFSLENKAAASLKLLERAIQLEPQFLKLAGEESDFDNIREDPGFVSLTKKKPESK